jgi:tetratricopeptide (TPR) repeat protein
VIDTEGFAEFRKGLAYLRDGYSDKALPHFIRAAGLEKENPFYRSYLGLTIARAEHRWETAEELCDSALRSKRDQPQLYLNLAEVYLASDRKQDALETLLLGMRFAQRDGRITRLVTQLSNRREPVIPFLNRSHFLNRKLGTLRHHTLRLLEGRGHHPVAAHAAHTAHAR